MWKSGSMKTRLLTAFLVLGIFLTLTISLIGYRIFERTMVSEIGNNRADVLHQVGDRVRQVKYNAYTLSNLYYYDHTLQEYLLRLRESETETEPGEMSAAADGMQTVPGEVRSEPGEMKARAGEVRQERERREQDLKRYLDRLTAQFKSSFHEYSMRFDMVLALEGGGGYSSGYSSGTIPPGYDYMSPKTKIWYKDMLDAGGEAIDIANYKDKSTGRNYFSTARVMTDGDGQVLAYLMISVEETQIREMYESVIRDMQNTIYIVDGEGTIISSSSPKLNGFNFFNMKNLDRLFGSSAYTFTKMRGSDILFTRYQEPGSGFTVLEEIPLEVLMEPIRNLRYMIIWVAFLGIGAAAWYAWHFARKTAEPISQLCSFMLQVEEENLDRPCQVEGYREINILSSRLNLMLGRMRELMQGIKQKEQQKRKMELSFLQAQINPHFMYNTLFSIKCMVDMEKNEEASRMLVSFIQLLRSTLSNPNEFVSIRDEFRVLQQYVDIQKFRYDDGFQVVFECDEAVEENKIPKLLIQPLLENAIFHGVEFKKGEGLIVITARKKGGDVVVTVEDNGIGIAPEVIEKIERGEQISGKTHVGIVNVKERIQLNFGESYGMEIESRLWEGTKIVLTLPAID